MPSNIDFSKPIYGSPTTQSVRDNFEIAQVEITNLQNVINTGPFVPIDGGVMTGPLELSQDPLINEHAVTKRYVDGLVFGEAGTVPDSPATGMFYARGGAVGGINDWSTDPIFTSLRIGPDKDTILFSVKNDANYNIYELASGGNDSFRFHRTTKVFDLFLNGVTVANFSDTNIVMNRPIHLSSIGLAKFPLKYSANGGALPSTDFSCAFGFNYSGGHGEADFVNCYPSAATSFRLYQMTAADTASIVASFKPAGILEINSVLLGLDPTDPKHAATKQYVDNKATSNNVGRNLIHNSLFTIAQRGTGPFITGGYHFDRWLGLFAGGSLSTSRIVVTDTDRAQTGDEAMLFALQSVAVGTAGAGDYTIALDQRLEDVRRTAGKTVIISFYAKATVGTPKLGFQFDTHYGDSGSPQVLGIGAQFVTLSTTWKRYSATIALPSIAGKTLGSGSFLALRLWQSAGATYNAQAGNVGVQSYTLQVWGVQVEIAQPGQTQPTPLEKLDQQQELANCQRFFQTSYVGNAGYQLGGQAVQIIMPLPVTMRKNAVYTNSDINQVNCTGAGTGAFGGPESFAVTANVTTTGVFSYYLRYTASADL